VIDRHSFVTGLGLVLTAPLVSEAQPTGKVAHVGILNYGYRKPDFSGFREQLRERYRERGLS
jgi:hypothetical protein